MKIKTFANSCFSVGLEKRKRSWRGFQRCTEERGALHTWRLLPAINWTLVKEEVLPLVSARVITLSQRHATAVTAALGSLGWGGGLGNDQSRGRHSCSLLNLFLLRRNPYLHLDINMKHVIKSQHMLIVDPFTALSDSLTVFAFIIQVQRSHSCWTAHPTTCTWPSSLTSACLLLVSIWSTQVWGEMPCLTTCHFHSAVTLFPCVRLASFSSCFSMLDGWGDASLGGSEKEEGFKIHSLCWCA